MPGTKTDYLNSEAIASRDTAFGEIGKFLSWLPNPDIVLQKSGNSIEVFDELLTDPFVKGCFSSRKAGVLKLEWDLENDNVDEKQQEFFKQILNNLDVYRLIAEMLNAPAYGYQIFELMWDNINGSLIPIDIVQKPARWFNFAYNNDLQFKSANNPMGEPVPVNKFLAVVNEGSYDNPYGSAILSQCFWSAVFKKGGLKFWTKFTEKYGTPWAVGKVPQSFTPAEVDKFLESLTNMVQDGVIVIPDKTDVKLEYPSSTSVDIYERLLLYCKDDISMAFLGHTKAGQSTPGQLGNNHVADDVRSDIVMADKRLIESAINKLIKIIFSVNFSSGQPPKFIMYEESDIDVNLANRDKILWDMGVRFSPDYIKKRHFIEEGDFTIADNPAPNEPPITNIIPTDQPAPTDTITPSDTSADTKFAAEPVVPSGQLIIDKKLEEITSSSKALIGNLTKQVKDYINGKSEFSEAIDGLSKLYPKMNSDELYDQLVKLQFAAELVGRFEVKSELGRKI